MAMIPHPMIIPSGGSGGLLHSCSWADPVAWPTMQQNQPVRWGGPHLGLQETVSSAPAT